MHKRIHSFTDDALGDLDATALAELIKNKELKASEVVIAAIERAKKINPEINAVVTDCYEKALTNADQHAEGFFGGVPMFFKDLTCIKGLPCYHGTSAFAGAKPNTKNDPIVDQILAQGFVNLGTTTMPDMGLTCFTQFPDAPPTRNPWNPEYGVGGSSGGSAALVAAGVVPIAHAADGGGFHTDSGDSLWFGGLETDARTHLTLEDICPTNSRGCHRRCDYADGA